MYISAPLSDDVYTVGLTVDVSEPIDGDLFVLGQTISIRSKVSQDITGAAKVFDIADSVGDDVRVAGETVRIMAPVAGDVFVAGATVVIDKGAVIDGDLMVAAADVTIRGEVRGKVFIRAGRVSMDGVLIGPTSIEAEDIHISGRMAGESRLAAKEITYDDSASFGTAVSFWSEDEFVFADATEPKPSYDASLKPFVDSKVIKDATEVPFEGILAILAGIFGVFSLLSATLILGLIVLCTRNAPAEMGKTLLNSYGTSFILGLIYFAVTPVIAFILMITIIGLPLGVSLLVIYFITLYFSKFAAALVFAAAYIAKNKKKWKKMGLFGAALLIFVLAKLVGHIPVIGWIAYFVYLCMGIGAALQMKWKWIDKVR